MQVMMIGRSPVRWSMVLAAALLGLTLAPTVHSEQPEFSTPERDATPFVGKRVRSIMQDYLSRKGWSQGVNVKQDGSEFFVAMGSGAISAPVSHPRYMASRAIAFDKAFLEAKTKMVEFINTSISTELKSAYEEGATPVTDDSTLQAEQAEDPMATALSDTLGNGKVSKLLLQALTGNVGNGQSHGSPPPAPSQISGIISSDRFQKSVKAVARSRVAGMQAFKVFESKRGEIGVIGIWSPKLRAMADAVYQGDPSRIPQQAPKRPLAQQIPSDPQILMTTFGVMQKRNGRGYPALVAFGQGIPVSDRARAIDVAYEKARLTAQGELRSYLGEMVSVDKDLGQSESIDDFSNRTSQYEFNENYKEVMASRADARSIKGISVLKEWEAVHPLSKRRVMGVVIAWTPTAARMATHVQSQMSAPTGPGADSKRTYGWDNRTNWQGMASQGAEGDEEEF